MDSLDTHYKKKNKISIFSNKNLTWFDPACGMGNYQIIIFLRLMEGLKNIIKNDDNRKKHILENMIYVSELNKKNIYIYKQIFDLNSKYEMNIHNGNSLTLNIKKKWNIKKFDIIIGNPPYQKQFSGKNGYAAPLYNEFVEKYIDLCEYLIFVTPSRWFSGGKGLDKFTKHMLNRGDIVIINHYQDSSIVFGKNVIIKGGVSYFIKDDNYNGKCMFNNDLIDLTKYDIIVDNVYIPILNKIIDREKITSLYCSKGYYKISLTDKRLHEKQNKNDILCYVSRQKGFERYIDKKYIDNDRLQNHKVITVTASTANNDCFGNMFIGGKNDIHSESYISFNVTSESEAKSLLSYLKCRLPNLLLKIRKITHNISETTCKWIPLPPLNKIWTDELIYLYFKYTKDEIKLINEINIKGYKNLKNKKLVKYDSENSDSSSEDEKPKKKVIKKIIIDSDIESSDSSSEDEKPKKKVIKK
jgi:site-specific DNA-methyltransferase (adenine-specific)